jgi:hypothetical protein
MPDAKTTRLKSHALMLARVHSRLVRGAYAYWITLDRTHLDSGTLTQVNLEFTKLQKITNENLIGVAALTTSLGCERWIKSLSTDRSVFGLVNSVLDVGLVSILP